MDCLPKKPRRAFCELAAPTRSDFEGWSVYRDFSDL